MTECRWPLLTIAKSQVDVQDVPSGVDVAMPVLVMSNWVILHIIETVCALRTLLDTPHLDSLSLFLFFSVFFLDLDLGGEDRFEL